MPEAFLVRMHHFVGQPARNRENRKRKRSPHMFFVRPHVFWIVGESTLEGVHKGRPLSLYFQHFLFFIFHFPALADPSEWHRFLRVKLIGALLMEEASTSTTEAKQLVCSYLAPHTTLQAGALMVHIPSHNTVKLSGRVQRFGPTVRPLPVQYTIHTATALVRYRPNSGVPGYFLRIVRPI